MRTELTIAGMRSPDCSRSIEAALRGCPGVHDVIVSLADGSADVEHDPEMVTPSRLVNLVEEEGYEAAQTTG